MAKKEYRITFIFAENAFLALQQIKKLTKAASDAVVIRDALRMYRWYLEAVRDGNIIILRKPDGSFVEEIFDFSDPTPEKKIIHVDFKKKKPQ